MKKPNPPPDLTGLLKKHSEAIPEILTTAFSATHKGHYIHWDKLRHLKPPGNLTHEQWWLGLKLARSVQYKILPMTDLSGNPFVYTLPDNALSMIHKIDSQTGESIRLSSPSTTEATRNRFIFNSLVEEAITSSQLEGASTTRQNAADMIRNQRKPKDISETMIMNNYLGMSSIRELKNQPISFDSLMQLQYIPIHK